jgi:hypothetical protein
MLPSYGHTVSSDFQSSAQCKISLPEATTRTFSTTIHPFHTLSNPTSAIPDYTFFLSPSLIKHLSLSKSSPFKSLSTHPSLYTPVSSLAHSFRHYSTPCAHLPESPGFEFASAFCEDKKISQDLGAAYRQNRMAAASALRHLYALHVEAPVFGLLWADGIVRAHVDWCEGSRDAPVSPIHPIQAFN